MKRKLLIFIFILPLFVHAQLADNFNDGDFTNNPMWSGDAAKWQVNSGQLQSNSTVVNDTFYLSTPSTLASDAQWELFVKLDFSTSGNNWVDIYLTSDNANLKGFVNGYFVRIGNTADDICLYRNDGNISVKIIDGVDGRSQPASSNNRFKIKVTRTSSNMWTLSDDNTGTGSSYFNEGTINDGTYTSSAFFGFSIKQSTASFFAKHYFDDIYVGPIVLDTILPSIFNLAVVDSLHLDVKFSEPVEQTSAELPSSYFVNNGIGNPSSASRDITDISLVHLSFASAFSGGIENTITINNVADLSSNGIQPNSSAVFYYVTDRPEPGDVVINEILFHAPIGGSEFVELYNASAKVLDLKDVFLYDGASNPLYTISATSRVFLPGDYVAVTRSIVNIQNNYTVLNPASLIQVTSMPSYTDGGDSVMIATASGQVLDKLIYSESWQLPLLTTTTGVSLERLNPYRPTQDQSNWHSAAESAGFATPGYRNSQYDVSEGNGDEISVLPEIFSPDNDGHNDVVNLNYHFENPGNVANVNVYDVRGRLIRSLVRNELIGNDGSFVWDGITDRNDKARVGMYVFYIEVYDVKGDTKNYKKTCVLASKL
jgi:hypothetical protein